MSTRTPLGAGNDPGNVSTMNMAITAAINAGDTVVVALNLGNTGTAPSVTCGADTYTLLGSVTGASHCFIFAMLNSTAHISGTNITANWTGSTFPSMWASKVNVTCTALDKTAGANGSGTAAASGATATTTQAIEWWFGAVTIQTASVTFSAATGGFTLGQAYNGAASFGIQELYQEVAATGAANAGCTISPTNSWGAVVVTLLEPAAASGALDIPSIPKIPSIPNVG